MGLGSGIVCSIRLNTVLNEGQKALFQNPRLVQDILLQSKSIAIIGLSTDPQKPSFFVGTYLKSAGYQVYPIHPKAETILGLKAYKSLAEIGKPVDVVDIFRPAQEIPALVEEAAAIGAKAVWQQLRINNLQAGQRALDLGMASVIDLCIKMEHGRYNGGLHEAGMNTELVSAKRTHRYF